MRALASGGERVRARRYRRVVGLHSSLRIISECTALYPVVIFLSAVVASPASWKHKLVGVLGVPILVAQTRLTHAAGGRSQTGESSEVRRFVYQHSLRTLRSRSAAELPWRSCSIGTAFSLTIVVD